MMRLSSLFKRFLRRSEQGQSVVVLALGFLALAAFVGITTDISVAFVRYAQLSRAVDSAAIAAANQMRQDTSHATLGLAARQFIEFHGIQPDQVDVLTCLTRPGDPNLCTEDQAKLVQVVAYVESPTFFMRLIGYDSFDLWASSISQTAALDVVLIMDVSESMLRYTSVADWVNIRDIGETFEDTADVTNLGVVYRPPTVTEILQAKGDDPVNDQPSFWETDDLTYPGLLNHPQIQVNNRLAYFNRDGTPEDADADTDTAYRVNSDNFFFNADGEPVNGGAGAVQQQHPREECRVRFYPSSTSVRVSSYVGYIDPTTEDFVGLDQIYADSSALSSLPTSRNGRFEGFVPTYNFYGCCNDPDGDGDFSDLVCQPFKQARDATFQFLERIDFTRGDRAAIVTFDRAAFLVNPYGTYDDGTGNIIQPGAMMDDGRHAFRTLRDLVGVRAEPNFYVFDSGTMSVEDDGSGNIILSPGATPLTASWGGYSAGVNDAGQSIPIDYGASPAGFDGTDGGNPLSYLYPVYDNCPFRNAGELNTSRTLFDYALSNISLPNGFNATDGDSRWTRWPVHNNPGASYPNALQNPGGLTISQPSDAQRIMDPRRSYEFWASCRGTNIGAALREGNNALLNPQTVRRFGTIWVMVLLSDGAAGASDPVRRNGRKLNTANPYQDVGGTFGLEGEYGAYGICPYGTPDNPGRLVAPQLFPFCSDTEPWTRHACDFRPLRTLNNQLDALFDNDYVRFNDPLFNPVDVSGVLTYTDPVSGATFAGPQSADDELPWNRANNNLYDLDLSPADKPGACHELYDVDDYARDWADYIGLQNLQANETAQLPTIFTIGFGLEFADRDASGTPLNIDDPADAVAICQENAGDCLGEQLLRYIADVGDNNTIDNDFYQDYLEDGAVDGVLFSGSFGARGSCQRTDQTHASGSYAAINGPADALDNDEYFIQWGQLPPQQSCGNYFFAPDGNELQFVFDEIASRMFTRLAR
jgi:hypothetical protein